MRLARGRHRALWFGALVCASVAFATSSALAVPDPDRFEVQRWTTRDGLPQSTVPDIVQDHRGYLWIATFGGLARFDGERFEVFDQTTPGLGSNRFVSLAATAGGRLWIGSESDGVFIRERGRFTACGPERGCPSGEIDDILVTGPDELLFATDGGVFRRLGGRLSRLHPGGDHRTHINQLTSDPDGRIWGASKEAVWRLDGDRFAKVPIDLRGGWVQSISASPREFAVATGTGILLRRGAHDTWLPLPGSRSGVAAGVGDFITHDRRGRLWFEHHGKLYVREPSGERFEVHTGLPIDPELHLEFMDLYEDREGTIWIGNIRRGLMRLRERSVRRYGGGGLASYSLTADGGDGVWVGARCDDLAHLGPEGVRSRVHLDNGGTGCLRAVLRDRSGTLWLGFQRRVSRWRDGVQEVVLSERELGGAEVRALFEPPGGGLLVGTIGGGVYELDVAGRLRPSARLAGLPDPRVQVFAQAAADRPLWVGTLSGLARFQGGSWQRWTHADGAPAGAVRAIHLDDDGVVWVGTYGGGLGRWDGAGWTRYTTREGLYENVISYIAEDGEGNLWCNGNRGLWTVSKADLEAFARGEIAEVQSLGKSSDEGNGGNQPAGARTADGALWFPGILGVTRALPVRRRQLETVPPPQAAVTRVTIGGQTYDPERAPVIEAPLGARSVAVSFAALTYLDTRRSLTRYRLVGLSDAWSVPSPRRDAVWPSLEPGTYRFEVMARNALGVWSEEPASVAIIIPPHLHERGWFRTAMWVLALLLAWGLHRWRLRARERHYRLLKREILQRQAAEAERRRLEVELARAQRLETLGRITGGVAHDFNNLLMAMQGAAQIQQLQVADGDLEGIAEQADFLLECIDNAATVTGQLLAFSRQPVTRPEDVSMAEVVRSMDKLIGRLLGPGIERELQLDDGASDVRINLGLFQQLLLNLCINAGDAMPSGGKLTIRTSEVDADALPDPAMKQRAKVWGVLEVSDQGVGIAPEDLEHVFDAFFTTRGGEGGTGLGLAVVRSAVDQARGRITVESEVGVGTTFKVYLPATGRHSRGQRSPWARHTVTPAPTRAEAGRPEPGRPGGDERPWVVVVDDDAAVLSTTREALTRAGYRVLAVEGAAALDAALEGVDERPALLITDVLMPGENGADLARRLAKRWPGLTVLFISGYTEGLALDEDEGDARRRFLRKPFSLEALLAIVAELVGDAGEGVAGAQEG